MSSEWVFIPGGRTIQKRLITSFYENSEDKEEENGTLTIKCKKGLWSANGRDQKKVLGEAIHYFSQYYVDGEYDKKPEQDYE